MNTWLDVQDCEHEPNARGTQCQHCGIPAELVTPDELAGALTVEMDAARLRASGQMSWMPYGVERERAIMAEMRAAAQWCAEHGLRGRIGDPLPYGLSARVVSRIAAMPTTFEDMVSEAAR